MRPYTVNYFIARPSHFAYGPDFIIRVCQYLGSFPVDQPNHYFIFSRRLYDRAENEIPYGAVVTTGRRQKNTACVFKLIQFPGKNGGGFSGYGEQSDAPAAPLERLDQKRLALRERDRGKALAGKSTLNRLELTPVGADRDDHPVMRRR